MGIRFEARPLPGIRGLVIQRERPYGDARKSALNEMSSLIRLAAMAEVSSIKRATQGCVVTS